MARMRLVEASAVVFSTSEEVLRSETASSQRTGRGTVAGRPIVTMAVRRSSVAYSLKTRLIPWAVV